MRTLFLAQLESLGLTLPATNGNSPTLPISTPITGETVATIAATTLEETRAIIALAHQRFLSWRETPAPVRGQLVRVFGDAVRANKQALGTLVSFESGKILSEGLGEIQEIIDVCEFAVGLSRQLHGLTIASERPHHKLLETWHPVGVCGVISAFNFPAAVWAWNASLAWICGNTVVWKPSEKTPGIAWALHSLLLRAAQELGIEGEGLSGLLLGDAKIGQALVESKQVPLISATGSTRMGREVATVAAGQFKRAILELGGNNAAIVAPSANLDLALRGIVFSAAGTAGQRCTTLRRLFVHDSIYSQLVPKIASVFAKLPVGSPLQTGTLVGPLIDSQAAIAMETALAEAKQLGANIHGGARIAVQGAAEGVYVAPALVEMKEQQGPMLRETFAPILYVVPYSTLDQAIAANNASAHGLSSSIFTNDLREAEIFTSASGSDCGIANVNIGTSGAEIGGAFGGEKETGGGRESGSDAWKQYMRRATNTVNYGSTVPLAQGVQFDPM